MNIVIIIIEMIIFAALFTVGIFTAARSGNKESAANIHNYPPDIQEEYFKTHEKVEISYKSKKVVFSKALGLLFFTGIIFLCALAAGAKTSSKAFCLLFY